jgi:molybdopterin-guanine dinucleotide biosynthesis protein A
MTAPIARDQLTGLVLAGGAGRRVGGLDKGLMPVAGRPLVHWVLAALRPQVDALMISANRNQARYRDLGVPVLADHRPGFLGPLAGVATGMAEAPTPWLLVVPCDTPLLPADLGTRLAAGLAAAGAEIAVVAAAGRRHPLHALMPTALATDLDEWLRDGGRAVRHYLARHDCVEIPFDDCPDRFANLNTPAELDRLNHQLGLQPPRS